MSPIGCTRERSPPVIRREDMEGMRYRNEVLTLGRPSAATERETAFAVFAQERLAQQYRIAALILGDPVEAQDVTHDAFELAWRRWDSLRDPHRLDAWFGRILVNLCRDRLRYRRRHPIAELSPDLIESLVARDALSQASDRDEIGRAFISLDPDQRIVIVLRFYVDLSIEQIADRVGSPAGTVKSRLHYALRKLSSALEAGRHGGLP